MAEKSYFIFLLSSIGVLNGIVFLAYTLSSKENRSVKDKIFLLLIAAITFRVLKSILMYHFKIPYLVKAFGLFSFASIGPLVYFYLKSWLHSQSKINYKIHFILPIVILLVGLFPEIHHTKPMSVSYVGFIISYIFIYVIIAIILFIRFLRNNGISGNLKKSEFYWILGVLVFVSSFVLSYALHLLHWLVPYLTGAILYSACLYFAIYYLINKKLVKRRKQNRERYISSNLTENKKTELHQLITETIEKESLFLDEGLSLDSLSEKMKIPSRIISQVINEIEQRNFKDFINTYRIKEACHRLRSDKYRQDTISVIAFESGFNSLSTFNAVFKKSTGQSPSSFRRRTES